MLYLAVGLAGGLGAILRYGLGRVMFQAGYIGFPYATMMVNVIGSFLIGYVMIALADKAGSATSLRTVVMSGFLGGFTTFSAFSLETVTMIERGDVSRALSYILITLVCCLSACAVGLAIGKSSV